VAGGDIFAAESGLHVDGILKNPALFEPYDPAQTGTKRILALGAKAGRGAVRTMLRQMGLKGPLHSITNLVDTIRQRANSTGRPLTQGEVQALAKHQECLDGGIC